MDPIGFGKLNCRFALWTQLDLQLLMIDERCQEKDKMPPIQKPRVAYRARGQPIRLYTYRTRYFQII